MRISDPGGTPISKTGHSRRADPPDNGRLRGPTGQAFSPDEVQLSNLSASLAAAQSNSQAWIGKISHLTAAVAADSYHIQAQAVSASIIDEGLRFSNLSRL